MLDNINLYWFTDTAASSARIYWENTRGGFGGPPSKRADRTAYGGVGFPARDLLPAKGLG
jgi:hypothetical protein